MQEQSVPSLAQLAEPTASEVTCIRAQLWPKILPSLPGYICSMARRQKRYARKALGMKEGSLPCSSGNSILLLQQIYFLLAGACMHPASQHLPRTMSVSGNQPPHPHTRSEKLK